MKTSIITNVLNEEFLIKDWLLHHKDEFDDGYVIDYGCEDSTIDIINDICPHWEILNAGNQIGDRFSPFGGGNDTLAIMDIEQEISGWKIALNTTEFVLNKNIKKYIKNFESNHPEALGFRGRGVVLTDELGSKYYNSLPIIQQKAYHGYFEDELLNISNTKENRKRYGDLILDTANWIWEGLDGRSRLMHKARIGKYSQGRHSTGITYRKNTHNPRGEPQAVWPRAKGLCPESDFYICHIKYSPMQISRKRTNRNHTYKGASLEGLYLQQLKLSHNLFKDKKYRETYINKYRNID